LESLIFPKVSNNIREIQPEKEELKTKYPSSISKAAIPTASPQKSKDFWKVVWENPNIVVRIPIKIRRIYFFIT